MKRTGFALALAAMLVLPAGAMGAPSKADTKAASKFCHDLRAESETKENFKAAGDPDYKNFGDCVRRTARAEAQARREARREARSDCKEQGLKGKEFRDCKKAEKAAAKAERREEREDFVNAAKTCRELQEDEAAFAEAYGERKNAFGKCVSEQAQAQNDEEEGEGEGETDA